MLINTIPVGLGDKTNKGRSNIEFEAKLYHDITTFNFSNYEKISNDFIFPSFMGNDSKEYIDWLNNMTGNHETFPKWRQLESTSIRLNFELKKNVGFNSVIMVFLNF